MAIKDKNMSNSTLIIKNGASIGLGLVSADTQNSNIGSVNQKVISVYP